MKKYLIFILLINLLSLCSCSKKEETFIECLKVSCYEDLNTSTKMLYLNIYTSIDILSPRIKETHNIKKAEISFKDSSNYIYNGKEYEAIFYQFRIYFTDAQVSINSITLINDDVEYIVDIGKYQLIKMPFVEELVTGEVSCDNKKLTLFIHNGLDRDIYIKKVSTYQTNHYFLNIDNNFNDPIIYEGATKKFECIVINIPIDYIYVSGILKVEFTTLIKDYYIYVFYCYNKTQEVINKRELRINLNSHIFYISHINVCLK